ncbi:hypothetical protein ACRAWF_23045 [Streptomyces sp. L7]
MSHRGGPYPLAVILIDHDGLVCHWSRDLASVRHDEGRGGRPDGDRICSPSPAPCRAGGDQSLRAFASTTDSARTWESSLDGQLHHTGRRTRPPHRARAKRMGVPAAEGWGSDRVDVLWWAYPLVGPGRERLLVLAADADGLRQGPYPEGGWLPSKRA